MADFCSTCSKDMWGPDAPSDFLIPPAPTNGQLELELARFNENIRQVLCEGCGEIWVNREGTRLDQQVVNMILAPKLDIDDNEVQ